jgi:fluoride exporter
VTTALAFVVFAAGGALARTTLSQHLNRPQGFPWGTLLVNATGSFLLALAAPLGPPVVTVLAVGGLGAYTTFSTFAVELVRLEEQHHLGVAAAYAVLSVGICTALAAAGLAL